MCCSTSATATLCAPDRRRPEPLRAQRTEKGETEKVPGVFAFCFSPLGKGFLTGKIDASTSFAAGDIRNNLPRFADEARAANHNLVTLIGEVAARKNATPAQVALAWLLAQKPWIAPIPGTTKLHRLEENIGGADVVLTADDLKALADVLARVPVRGERYNAQMMQTINR